MPLTFKSDISATRSLGNINGINGPQDYALHLDFQKGIYRTKSAGLIEEISIEDFLTVARSSPRDTQDRDGTWRTLAPATPRFRYHPSGNGYYGLLLENNTTNLLPYSDSPSSQSFSVDASVHSLILYVHGTGSATLTGDVEVTSAVATEGEPAVYEKVRDSGDPIALSLNVTGDVTFAQVEQKVQPLSVSSPVHTAGSPVTTSAEILSMADGFLSSHINAGQCTVVVQSIETFSIKETEGNIDNQPFSAGDADRTYEIESEIRNSYTQSAGKRLLSRTSRLRPYVGGTPQVLDVIDIGIDEPVAAVTAAAYENGVIKHASDGNVYTISDSETYFDVNWLLSKLSLGPGITTQVLIYPRALSDQELSAVTKSWAR
ncbi:hypothetical protein NUW46_04855 [Marinobacter sp. MA]|uniref:hypothetical protein n=1 Tax=Marinobacter sp. MA TaxID=2971606 RepID=UPI003AAF207B